MLWLILEFLICFLLSVFLITGIISLSLLVFYCKNQRNCRSIIFLSEHDTNAEIVIKACVRADRLLGRTMPPIVVDLGMTAEAKAIVRHLAVDLDLTLIAEKQAFPTDNAQKIV